MNRYVTTFTFVLMMLFQPAQATTWDSHPSYNPSEYALVFFFRSDCNHCHLFARSLKIFEQQTGLFTYAFSLDGKGMPGYDVPIPATPEIGAAFFDNPRSVTVPATFLINVNSRKFARMTVGNVPLQSLQATYNKIRLDPQVIEALRP